MKKILAGALTAAVVLTAGGAVWAAGGRSAGWRYVDADGDGVCDNQGTGYCWVDANGDGICDHQGAGCGWVDADGDGICDNQVPAGGMWMQMAMVSATIRAQAGGEWGGGLREAATCKNGVM